MGTHPIFESDFDCLTEQSEKKCQAEEDRKNQRKKRPLNQWLAANGKKADVDDHPEKSAKKQLHAFISFKKQNTQAALDFKKKTGDETHYTKLLGNWWKELDDKTKESFKDADFKYVIKK